MAVPINDTKETRLLDDENEDEYFNNNHMLNRQISDTSTIKTDIDYDDPRKLTDGSDDSNDSNDGPTTLIGKAMHWFTMPLQLLFKFTCPPA
eukprot:263959_1